MPGADCGLATPVIDRRPEIQKHMKQAILPVAAVLLLQLPAGAQNQFLPNHLAVLRAGDGVVDLKLRQAPIFVDQFDPAAPNTAASFTVHIPTNGPSTLFFNGHAATEGILTRSSDHQLLAFAGYGGVSLLQSNGTPSVLDIGRGCCTVDAHGTVHTYLYESHSTDVKVNPRGIVTDGANNFWGCGNANGTLYYSPTVAPEPVRFASMPNSRAIRIVDHQLYATLNGADAKAADLLPGIYGFMPVGLPRKQDAPSSLVVPAASQYAKIAGFDMNPMGTVAYVADTTAGIQKYVKENGAWKFAYNFTIPQSIPPALNNAAGCFALVADFSGVAPVVYATTTEGYDGSVNSNRVVRVVDTNAHAAVTTIACAGSTNIVFRGIDFTPEAPAVHAEKFGN